MPYTRTELEKTFEKTIDLFGYVKMKILKKIYKQSLSTCIYYRKVWT